MSDWGGGYVTDIPYKPGYYPEQSPWHLSFCATLCGFETNEPRPDDPLSYLELGCGLGFGALMLASANPRWQVTAIDFNAAHVAQAERMAREAGLTNIRFIEADLASLVEARAFSEIPMADYVSLHGLWSWVRPEVRTGIIGLLKERVRPGGVVHVSYNALPAWQGGVGMQRLVREAGSRLPARSDRQAAEGFAMLRRLYDANAKHLRHSPFVAGMMDRFAEMPPDYLAHEFMNGSWSPCFHADVVAAFAEARLDWVGSANIEENFPDLMLEKEQKDLQSSYDDVVMRELIKDMCLERALRSDIFVRGAARRSGPSRNQALGAHAIGLTVAPKAFKFDIPLPVGVVSMSDAFYDPIVVALANGPRLLSELVALPELEGHSRNPAEVAGMLLGSNQAALVARPAAGPGDAARRVNAMSARRFIDTSRLSLAVAAASDRLGGALKCTALELFLLDRIAAAGGWIDASVWAAELGPDLPRDQAARLQAFMEEIAEERWIAWRTAGLV